MAEYVIDVSAIMPYFLTEVYTANATALFNQHHPQVDKFCVPHFCKIGCVNVLWKQVRFHGMPQEQGEKLIEDLSALPLEQFSVEELYPEAFRIGIKHQLAIYDSVYIALAKHLNYPLVTVDQKQSTAALQENVTLKPITDFVQ
jgi:predicted nucleic acid-binding protein